MKRNLLSALAIATVVVFSAFTANKKVYIYYEYGFGNQSYINSYYAPTLTSPGNIPGADVLAWIRVEAQDFEGATQEEFTTAFDQLNVTHIGALSLNDEVDNHVTMELRAQDN